MLHHQRRRAHSIRLGCTRRSCGSKTKWAQFRARSGPRHHRHHHQCCCPAFPLRTRCPLPTTNYRLREMMATSDCEKWSGNCACYAGLSCPNKIVDRSPQRQPTWPRRHWRRITNLRRRRQRRPVTLLTLPLVRPGGRAVKRSCCVTPWAPSVW
jgi:hypothetical protein